MKRKFLIAGGIGCGSIMLIFVLIIVVLLMDINTEDGGLMLENELAPYALEYLENNKILKDSEKVLAYYDNTVSLDGSDVMILTSERLITRKNGKSTEIELKDIKEVKHHKTLGNDFFTVISRNSGICMKIQIAPFNGGESFMPVLTSARENSK